MTTQPLVEAVPNFSEGRDAASIAAIADVIRATEGVALLDVHTDRWHHRSVMTVVGRPEAVAESMVRAAAEAVARIDLTRHEGVHPRIGSVDVLPFVPYAGLTMRDCVALAGRVAARLGEDLDLPVFLYADAARHPERRGLAALRRSGIERLRHDVASGAVRPDFGPARLHATAGAVAVGARPFLIAFNVVLDTPDIAVARDIARTIRHSSGGLPGVQALGVEVAGRAQVSMNLTDLAAITPVRVFDVIESHARSRGVAVHASEFVGLVPGHAMPADATTRLKLSRPAEESLLEPKLEAVRLGD